MSAEKSAGVRDGMEALAFGGTERHRTGRGEKRAVCKLLLTSPADSCSERNSGGRQRPRKSCRRVGGPQSRSPSLCRGMGQYTEQRCYRQLPLGFLGTCRWSWRLIGSTIALLVWFEHLPEGMGGLHRVKREANFETKASGVRSTLVGGSRVVVVAGERRTRRNRGTDTGYTDAKHRSESRKHSR
jgi:hypothetical protein